LSSLVEGDRDRESNADTQPDTNSHVANRSAQGGTDSDADGCAGANPRRRQSIAWRGVMDGVLLHEGMDVQHPFRGGLTGLLGFECEKRISRRGASSRRENSCGPDEHEYSSGEAHREEIEPVACHEE
jgi:hypothetical protein